MSEDAPMKLIIATSSVFSLLLVLSSLLGAQDVDVVVTGARIETMDDKHAGATALAIRDGRIVRIGTDDEILALAGEKTHRVDAGGHFVMPGFVDSHSHFVGLGSAMRRVRLNGMTSWKEIVARVRDAAKDVPKGRWILGRGWDQNLWENKAFPDHAELSAAVPDHPVVLARIDGHALIANAAAMSVAGVTPKTACPDGGEMPRRADGALTGVFIDAAESLIMKVVPDDDRETLIADMLAAQDACLAHGITTFHDAGTTRRRIGLMDELFAAGKLRIRLNVMVGVESAREARLATAVKPIIGAHGGRLTVRTLKIYADGALGSRGAALLNDYHDRPGHRGLLVTRRDELAEISAVALKAGYQASVHAIGDRANRMILDVWEELFAAEKPKTSPRFRIEHAQVLHEDDIKRFGPLGVIASIQAVHCTSDMAWVAARISKGARRSAPIRGAASSIPVRWSATARTRRSRTSLRSRVSMPRSRGASPTARRAAAGFRNRR